MFVNFDTQRKWQNAIGQLMVVARTTKVFSTKQEKWLDLLTGTKVRVYDTGVLSLFDAEARNWVFGRLKVNHSTIDNLYQWKQSSLEIEWTKAQSKTLQSRKKTVKQKMKNRTK